jgi:SAM-dependent methyltransferase
MQQLWIPESYQQACLAVARQFGFSTTTASVAVRVRALSDSYNREGMGSAHEHGAARLLFFFQRDLPKMGLAVHDLLASGLLEGDKPLRVLDYGAGLGASTFGLQRALELSGSARKVEATLFEPDPDARALGSALARKLGGSVRYVDTIPALDRKYDLVLLGQVLSEIERDSSARLESHAQFVKQLLRDAVGKQGSVVIVEPALRERARHLQALGRALEQSVFSPCMHQGACPLLVRERDWCHEDHDVNLPAWLVPLAQSAGLRYEGLTFSFLILRSDGANVRSYVSSDPQSSQRLVSGLRRTKGKIEAVLCPHGPTLRLDRDATEGNHAFGELARGSVVDVNLLDGRVRGESLVRLRKPSPRVS